MPVVWRRGIGENAEICSTIFAGVEESGKSEVCRLHIPRLPCHPSGCGARKVVCKRSRSALGRHICNYSSERQLSRKLQHAFAWLLHLVGRRRLRAEILRCSQPCRDAFVKSCENEKGRAKKFSSTCKLLKRHRVPTGLRLCRTANVPCLHGPRFTYLSGPPPHTYSTHSCRNFDQFPPFQLFDILAAWRSISLRI